MRPSLAFLVAGIAAMPAPALAWGYEGHKVVATIARTYLTNDVLAKVDAILAADQDALTMHDMASEATWADAYRSAGHRETAQWHFVDQEIDGSGDLRSACFGFPSSADPGSSGPAQDCVVDRINEFASELAAPDTPPHERLLALKYVLHLVGDVHQPLHAADNHDRGGNCVLVALGGSRSVNLHSFWDTWVVETVSPDSQQLAASLAARISQAQAAQWRLGTPGTWARESFAVARSSVYTIGSPPGCGSDSGAQTLAADYEATAVSVAALQMQKAGVRLAAVLNRALATVDVGSPGRAPPLTAAPAAVPVGNSDTTGRSPSQACSAEADARDLHGEERRRFRSRCKRERGPS